MTAADENDIYPARLSRAIGNAWRQFWFLPASDLFVARLRIAIGMFCLIWLYSFSTDVAGWFGPNGILSVQAVRNIEESSLLGSTVSNWRFSLLDFCQTASQVRTAHMLAFGFVVAFTVGFATPFTSLATFLVISSFIQRAPIVFGIAEHVLLFAVLYLCIAPSGRVLSIDSILQARSKADDNSAKIESASIRSNICLRMIQVHLAMIFLYSGLSKLSGEVWWNGEAVWWMLVQPESTLTDLTRLGADLKGELFMNAWTYAIVLAELLGATLIWVRIARPVVMTFIAIVYLSLIPLTGLVGYCGLVVVLLSVFLHHSDPKARESCVPQPVAPS